ncbi:MAG: NADH-quinone oxidoreductase subunit NuoF [Desulfobacter sp.]|nr:MAG: NADH-quinone oxidoreductase subunit NuoF [Desulfobacter sp.]
MVSRARLEWETLQSGQPPVIRVGTATCGRSAGAFKTLTALRSAAGNLGLDCRIMEVGCLGLCYAEPVVSIAAAFRPQVLYGWVDESRALEIMEKDLVKGEPVEEYALGTLGRGRVKQIPRLSQTDVFKHQVRRILKRCGMIDPACLSHYLANNGYSGLKKAVDMGWEEIIEAVTASGLRGRGGAGFATGVKWGFCRKAEGEPKYLICNADEGDPGAFMNRSLLEGDPHALIEGMVIAGKGIGASRGFIYCRAEYPLALERLETAIKQARRAGFLGADIMGSGFDFDITIKKGAGAFVCGEETALIASIEGRRGMPRPRPPFPAVSGLWGKPTIINNVETLASVALILQQGAKWYADFGSEKSKGTKTFALVGEVKRPGLVEVPLGITIREMIFDIGGGVRGDKEFKAVQTGGPSGGCIPARLQDTPVDYDSLTAVGSIMGSGGMVVMNTDSCMVDVAKYFLEFTQKESCGGCVPCRLGTKQMLDILEDITEGKGSIEDLDILEELCRAVKGSALCGLGQTAPNPVLSTIRYFKSEYLAHIVEKKCPARVCRALISYFIDPEACAGCGSCIKSCPAGAVSGRKKKVHVIDQSKCIRCGACMEKCPARFHAVQCIPGKIF